MSVTLKGTYEVVKIKKKTTAKFFQDLKVGDIFSLKYGLSGSYGNSAPYIDIYVKGKKEHCNNALQLDKNLRNFDLIEQK